MSDKFKEAYNNFVILQVEYSQDTLKLKNYNIVLVL